MSEEEKQEYIKKRQAILNILKSLFGQWELAEGLYALVGSKYITKEALDSLVEVISSAMKNIEEQNKNEQIKKSIELLDKMKEEEEKQKVEEQKQADGIFLDLELT
ncbi:hypothetical protein KAZ01_02545 [Candidatus Gracilibacteria bacterium]|nr:hypothetical protein [Candidatus Gracilibacteria bacterium]